jgi:c-di-GMP-binding flagellar brake protein YcgR
MYFARIRKEDESLSFDSLDNYSEEQIDSICFKRGIEIDKQSLKEKKQDLKLWLSISN